MKEPVAHKVMSVLRQYGSVSEAFLAQKLDRSERELARYLEALEKEELISREDHRVKPIKRAEKAG